MPPPPGMPSGSNIPLNVTPRGSVARPRGSVVRPRGSVARPRGSVTSALAAHGIPDLDKTLVLATENWPTEDEYIGW